MKRILLKILTGLLITLLSLSALLMGAALVFQKKAKSLIIQAINAQVTEPVNVQGGIDLSLIAHFPYASVTFHDVSVLNRLKGGPVYLLNVKEFSFLFNMWGLIGNKIQVRRVHVYDGAINLYRDESGNVNYEIFKPSKDTASAGGLNMDLRMAIVKNVRFTYLSESKAEDINLDIKKLDLSGNFRSDQFDLFTSGDLRVQRLRLNNEDYLTDKSFNADVTININQKEKRFTLNKANVDIEKNKFEVKGYFISGKRNTYVDFDANTKGKDISRLIALIPLKYKATLAGTEGKGAYEVSAKIYGNVHTGLNPIVEVNAKLDDAEIQLPRIRKALTHVGAEGHYRMDSVGNDQLEIRHFHSEFNGHPQLFDLSLRHLREPDFVFDADGVADLHELRTFFSDSVLQNAEGLLTFHHFHMQGSSRDFKDAENMAVKISGDFEMKDVEIEAGGVTYGNINGGLSYKDNVVIAKGLTLNFLSTDFVFDGRVSNLLQYAVSQNNRRIKSDMTLGVSGTLHMRSFNLSNILKAYAPTRGRGHPDTDKEKLDVRDVFNMQGHLNVTIGKFVYEKMTFEDLKADISLVPYEMNINSLTTSSMGGAVKADGYVAFGGNKTLTLNLGLDINKLDLPVLFRQCDNFGQTTLTDRNLKGLITASLQLKTVWNNYKDINKDKISGKLTCSVLHGELIGFAPIQSASKFIKVEELNHIIFSDLTNEMSIRNGIITIPMMEVQSSALNLMMSGTHTFDNQIDYQIKVNLRKVLAAKFGRRNSEVSYIEEDPYEGVNLYLRMTGDISDPHIRYDRESVKKKMKQDLAAQKEELKDLFKKDKARKPKNEEETKREEKYYDTRKKPEFIDFDEDKKDSL